MVLLTCKKLQLTTSGSVHSVPVLWRGAGVLRVRLENVYNINPITHLCIGHPYPCAPQYFEQGKLLPCVFLDNQ